MSKNIPQFRNLLSDFIDISPISYSVYDLVRDTLLFTTKNLIGLPNEELVRMSHNYYQEIIHPDDYEEVKNNVNKIKAASLGDQIEQTVRVKHNQGEYLWIYVLYRVHKVDDGGKPIRLAGIVQDITRVKKLEIELEEAIQRLTAISYRDAHLLRAPVATILGLINIMEAEELIRPESKSFLQYLKASVEKLDEIVSEIHRENN